MKRVEEKKSVQCARALRRAAELYVAMLLTEGTLRSERALERGAALEAIAVEYGNAVREEKRCASRARAKR